MNDKVFVIDGANFRSFTEFTQEFNRVFADIGADWNGNLEAFHDYLFWPLIVDDDEYTIVWRNSVMSEQALGLDEKVIWLSGKIDNVHPANRETFQERLNSAIAGHGPTMFDDLIEIIHDNSFIHLRLE